MLIFLIGIVKEMEEQEKEFVSSQSKCQLQNWASVRFLPIIIASGL